MKNPIMMPRLCTKLTKIWPPSWKKQIIPYITLLPVIPIMWHSFRARNSVLFFKDALVWASMVYGLNPHLKCEADHRASCQKSTCGMVCTWVSYGLFFDLYTAFKYVWSVLGPVLYQSAQAWASVESGVQRAFTSYCMTRFQRTCRSRRLYAVIEGCVRGGVGKVNHHEPWCWSVCSWSICFNHSHLTGEWLWALSRWCLCVCVQLRGGREGMSKIKSIIHAKLKARSLKPNMLKKMIQILAN